MKYMMLKKLFNTFVRTQKVQVHKHWAASMMAFKTNSMCTDAFDTNSLSLEEKVKILEVINNKSPTDLLQYSITETRAQNLELHRANNGPYKSLEDLLEVKGMNNKCLYKFYKSIIYGKESFPKKIRRGLILTPKTTNTNHKDVNTVLGIYIGQNIISWSLINRDCEVLHWSYKSFPENQSKKNFHSLLQITLPIAKSLPKADRYVLQEAQGEIGYHQSRSFYHDYMQQSMITTSILSYLVTSNSKFGDITGFLSNNVFVLRQHTLRKLYGLLINNETISTQYMLQKLLQESDRLMETKERLPSVLISTELKNMYNKQNSIYKEELSWSLLIALAFLELVVHDRTDMIIRNIT